MTYYLLFPIVMRLLKYDAHYKTIRSFPYFLLVYTVEKSYNHHLLYCKNTKKQTNFINASNLN